MSSGRAAYPCRNCKSSWEVRSSPKTCPKLLSITRPKAKKKIWKPPDSFWNITLPIFLASLLADRLARLQPLKLEIPISRDCCSKPVLTTPLLFLSTKQFFLNTLIKPNFIFRPAVRWGVRTMSSLIKRRRTYSASWNRRKEWEKYTICFEDARTWTLSWSWSAGPRKRRELFGIKYLDPLRDVSWLSCDYFYLCFLW